MSATDTEAGDADAEMMQRCLALSQSSGAHGEYPYAAVIARKGKLVCESINRASRDRDVTRHAEVVALTEAQKVLDSTSLDDCTIYINAEPCAYCSYAIRETRIGRVVYGLQSPLMGGHSRWDILADTGLSTAIPEVFAEPPEIIAGYMENEAEEMFETWHPMIWQFIKSRRLFVRHSDGPGRATINRETHRNDAWHRIKNAFRRIVIDRIGR